MRDPQTAAGQPANYINHIFIVGDMSPSMLKHKTAFIRVFDNFVAHLAARSQERGQETRISAYLFAEAGTERCVIWDKDVLRMPSIAEFYDPQYYGRTALIDATMLAIGDIGTEVSQKYGDHAIMVVDITDGQENHSRRFSAIDLRGAITRAPVNQTYLCFVPDQLGVHEAKDHGFPAENISVWDTSSTAGVESMGEVLREAADAYMEGRERGIRGYNAKSGYSGGGLLKMRQFTASDVRTSLTPVTPGSYYFMDVRPEDCGPDGRVEIEPFFVTRSGGHAYPKGKCYYEFTKTENIQGYKAVAVQVGGDVYSGTLDEVRGLLGLPDHHTKVKPDDHPGSTIFIQSTSHNRKLGRGTRLLVLR